jgi:hypothetical protein
MMIGRTFKKKVISEDLLFSDDFDENVLDKIEGELGKSFERDSSQNRPRSRSLDQPGTQNSGGKGVEQIDPTVSDRGMAFLAQDEGEDQKAPTETLKGSGTHGWLKGQQQASRSRKALLFFAASVPLCLAVALGYTLWPHPVETGVSIPQIVRHPIVVPAYERELNFLILANAAGKKDLLRLDLEFDFYGLEAYQKFKDKQLFYTDVIYGFLHQQQPSENSFQRWETISERDLLESLKKDYPEVRFNSIRMKNFHRL